MAPSVQCIKMPTEENVYKVTPMMFKQMSALGGPGDGIEQGVSVIDNSPMHLYSAIPYVIIPLLGSK